jgi:hypothetical protein
MLRMLVVFPELRTLLDRYWKHKGILCIPIGRNAFLNVFAILCKTVWLIA